MSVLTHSLMRRLWRRKILAAFSAVLLVALLLTATLVQGLPRATAQEGDQEPPSVRSTTQQTQFPTAVAFSAIVDGAEQLEEAILFYQVLPEGAITRQVAELILGDISRLSASVPTGTANTYIPAGAEIEWFWQLTTVDGEVIETDRELFRYEDPRYDWQPLTGDNLILYYYGNNESVAQLLFREGEDAIVEMSALLGITLDFPARVYMWASTSDATGVERTESDSFEEVIVTGGTRVLADLVHVFQPTVWVVRHELTHVLTKIAGEGGIGNIPSWLDEGTATYAEGDWRARRGQALNFAIENDTLFNVRSMVSVSNVPGRVDIFYGQAADLVTFLINTFGEDQFAEFFGVFKRGSTVDNALLEIYGFDRDGLDAAYRQLLGLPGFEPAEDRSTTIEDDVIAPIGVPVETAEIESDGDVGNSSEATSPVAEATDSAAEQPGDEIAPRSEEEVAARVAELERRLATRRPAAVFTTGSEFPWDELVTGVGAGALALGLGLFLLLLRHNKPGGQPPLVGETSGTPPPASPPLTLPPSSDSPAEASAPTTDEPTSSVPDGDSESKSDEWSGWSSRDDR